MHYVCLYQNQARMKCKGITVVPKCRLLRKYPLCIQKNQLLVTCIKINQDRQLKTSLINQDKELKMNVIQSKCKYLFSQNFQMYFREQTVMTTQTFMQSSLQKCLECTQIKCSAESKRLRAFKSLNSFFAIFPISHFENLQKLNNLMIKITSC